MMDKQREAFETSAGKRESAPTTSAWDYAFKAWQAATTAERERVKALEEALQTALKWAPALTPDEYAKCYAALKGDA